MAEPHKAGKRLTNDKEEGRIVGMSMDFIANDDARRRQLGCMSAGIVAFVAVVVVVGVLAVKWRGQPARADTELIALAEDLKRKGVIVDWDETKTVRPGYTTIALIGHDWAFVSIAKCPSAESAASIAAAQRNLGEAAFHRGRLCVSGNPAAVQAIQKSWGH